MLTSTLTNHPFQQPITFNIFTTDMFSRSSNMTFNHVFLKLNTLIFGLLSVFVKITGALQDHLAVCVCVSPQLLKARIIERKYHITYMRRDMMTENQSNAVREALQRQTPLGSVLRSSNSWVSVCIANDC
jgi:hypothetical protein